ncbi:MAG: hypothetical protein M1569_01135 [Candidatus Marsarchaeota archaeon]|nr:hypothetical protein [Candidatus Marsarchaeota archaeon]MCL5412992.1 hypothetical protein [Candidatus Marsarchaeota archaeon]
MNYSFNLKSEDFVRAISYDINASYKDLGAACDAVRYMRASDAISVLDRVMSLEHAIPYRRHNKHMGSRHELGGSKGAYPRKAAAEVKKTIENAIANANNKGKSGSDMPIVWASANKTRIERRYPSKGSIAWGRGMYGRSATNHSDIEYAKIEIVLADEFSDALTKGMRHFINKRNVKKGAGKEQKNSAKPQAKKENKAMQTEASPVSAPDPDAKKEAAVSANKG